MRPVAGGWRERGLPERPHRHVFTMIVADAERPVPDLLPKQFEQGWDAFAELVAVDVGDAVLELTLARGPGRRPPVPRTERRR